MCRPKLLECGNACIRYNLQHIYPLYDELCDTADEQQLLFDNVRLNASHILHSLLPPESSASQNYSLRPRIHNLQLPDHASHLVDSNFIERILFKTSLY